MKFYGIDSNYPKKCHKCEQIVDGNCKTFNNHVRWCNNPKKLKGKKVIAKCLCGIEYETNASRPQKFCSMKCVMSQESIRNNISMGRKKFLAENPEKHPWKNSEKFRSHPCELLKSRMRESGIPFVEEFQPLDGRGYSVDIALPGTNLAIEVNGNQHYGTDGKLKPYYQERHNILETNGWKVIEVHFSYCYSSDWVDSFLEAIVKDNDVSAFISLPPRFKQRREKKVSEAKQTCPTIIERLREMDKTSFGWVVRASKELGICTTHIRRLVLKHMPEQPRFERKAVTKA